MMSLHIYSIQSDYIRATRCWQTDSLKSCLLICDDISKNLHKILSQDKIDEPSKSVLLQLKNLVWLLKIKCLAADYYVNESLLLNEDDIESEDQVRVISSIKSSVSNSTKLTTTSDGRGRRIGTGDARRPKTGILTGKMPSVSSRHSSRATSSYRPLTTSLTATQTAFSRSTKPLLKYSTCDFLSKPLFEYLYNAQAVTSQCPDYRQCLEYLNLVQNKLRSRQQQNQNPTKQAAGLMLKPDENHLGVFWLIAFGTCYFNLHMNKQAEEYFQRAICENPRYLDSYAWLIKIYLRTNQPLKVLQTCDDGLKYSKNAILFNWMARVKLMMNDAYGANLSLKESLKYQPTNTEALANVGHFAFYGDKLEQSLKCFERIQQISLNNGGQQALQSDSNSVSLNESPELLNNLALCYFYNGYHHKVMPLFQQAFLNSTSNEVTSNIWYNLSFIPLNCGFKNLAIACLRLALKNNSQNEEAINNLGVLKYSLLVNEHSFYDNRIEYANTLSQQKLSHQTTGEGGGDSDESAKQQMGNVKDPNLFQAAFDDAETYFSIPGARLGEEEVGLELACQPEMLYNMAVIKKRRGQLLASVKYCNLYLEQDKNNYHIQTILNDIKELIE